MTEQPPSAEALDEAYCANMVSEHEPLETIKAVDESLYWQIMRMANAIDRVSAQRVSAETERWQNRDRQRLEQIDRLQETVQSFQAVASERDAALLARLQESDVREALAIELYTLDWESGPQCLWEQLKESTRERWRKRADAALTTIAERLP